MSVWNLLREFRNRKVHMAIVLNEYGGAIGVCSGHFFFCFFCPGLLLRLELLMANNLFYSIIDIY